MSANNQVSWHITAQMETVQAGPTGQFQRGYSITFQTDSGLAGTVFVPETAYNPANVAAKVAEQVQRMVAVHGLRGNVRANP